MCRDIHPKNRNFSPSKATRPYTPTLNWIGKEAVVKHHKEVPFRLLGPVLALSYSDADSGNLIVQGDNLPINRIMFTRMMGALRFAHPMNI